VSKGYIQIRRGLEEHLLAGRIGAFEAGVYLIIHFQVDFTTGVWTGSAPRLLASAPRGATLRDMQRALARLEEVSFIRVFHRQGSRGNYRVLIHKYEPQSGALRGQRLNALKSTSWSSPMYGPCTDDALISPKFCADDVTEPAPYLKEEVKTTHSAPGKANPIPSSLEQQTQEAAFEVFWEKWPRKQAKPPARKAWGKIPIAEYPPVMAGLEKWLRSEQWVRGVIPHPATWLNEKRWQDEDIPQFVGRIDGKPTGKQSATDLAMQNARALGLNRVPD
jgi:hypothetical protein